MSKYKAIDGIRPPHHSVSLFYIANELADLNEKLDKIISLIQDNEE